MSVEDGGRRALEPQREQRDQAAFRLGPWEGECPEPMPGEQLQPASFGAWLCHKTSQRATDFLGFSGPLRPPVSDLRGLEVSAGPRTCLPLLPFLPCQRGLSDTSAHFPQGRPQLSHAGSCLACLSSSGGVSVPALCVMRASHSHGVPTPVRSDLPPRPGPFLLSSPCYTRHLQALEEGVGWGTGTRETG